MAFRRPNHSRRSDQRYLQDLKALSALLGDPALAAPMRPGSGVAKLLLTLAHLPDTIRSITMSQIRAMGIYPTNTSASHRLFTSRAFRVFCERHGWRYVKGTGRTDPARVERVSPVPANTNIISHISHTTEGEAA